MAYRDSEPFLALGGKIDPLSEIRNAGIVTSGSVFWVKAQADSDYTTFQFQVGANVVLNGLQAGINKARADKNDFVMVIPKDSNTVWANDTVGSALLVNKARVHLVSTGYTKALYGYSNTLQGIGTAVGMDSAIVKVLAPATEIAGFRFFGTSGTTANGTMSQVMLLGTAASGTANETWVHDTVLETNNASAGGANGTPDTLTISGTASQGARFDNVSFINNASNAGITLGNGNSRLEFVRCRQVVKAVATSDVMVNAGTGASDYVLFKECDFININSAQKPASMVAGSTTTTNPILLSYCTGVNVTTFGTDPTVYAAPTQSGTAGAGIHNPGIFIIGSAVIPAV